MSRGLIAAVVALVIAAGAAIYWARLQIPEPAGPAARPPAPAVSEPAVAAPSPPAIQYPVEVDPQAPVDAKSAMTSLFGRETVLSMFQLEDFPRRFVATVDNLTRSQASSRIWPVTPPAGRFAVDRRDGEAVIGADNGLRYTRYVLLLEKVDVNAATATYQRLYPQLQKAYEDLGYPGRYFNDRLVQVVDHLLATPEIPGAPKVHLPNIQGPVKAERPWVLYQFDDPALEALSAGQKLLIRMGPVNQRRVKAKLQEFRTALTAVKATR